MCKKSTSKKRKYTVLLSGIIALKPGTSAKEPTINEISALKIENIWLRASIPVVSNTRILQMIEAYHDKYRNLLKSKSRKTYLKPSYI